MKEKIRHAHQNAMNQVDLAFDVDYLIKLAGKYITDEMSINEIIEELADTYKEPVKEYVYVFKESLLNEIIEEQIHQLLSHNEVLNKEEFEELLIYLSNETRRKIEAYITKKIDAAELMDFIINTAIKEISYEIIKAYGIDMEDVDLIIMKVKEGSYKILAYAACSELYKIFMDFLNEASLIHEQRLQVEMYCNQAIEEILLYRNQINELVSDYLCESIEAFQSGLKAMDMAMLENDSNGYIKGNLEIQKALGYDIQFESQDEFDDLMASDFDFTL